MLYPVFVFSESKCSVASCEKRSFADTGFCLDHLRDKTAAIDSVCAKFVADNKIINLDLSGLELQNRDFSRTKFVGCSFMYVRLNNVMFTGASFRLCFFDFSTFASCDFSGVDVDFCSFGNADLFDTSFENSELIHTSFDGCRIKECSFASSNLYDSRFTMSNLDAVRFDDCDFKRVYFFPTSEKNLSSKGSNIIEAVRDLEHLYL